MSAHGLPVFDRTLHTTHIWIDELMAELGPSRTTAWHALGVVLRTIRDRVTLELAVHLGAQLPLLVRGAYYEQFCPGSAPDWFRSLDAFLGHVQDGLDGGQPISSRAATAAVFRVLSRHIDEGQVAKVKSALPDHIRRFWDEAAAGLEGPEARAAKERRETLEVAREGAAAEPNPAAFVASGI